MHESSDDALEEFACSHVTR